MYTIIILIYRNKHYILFDLSENEAIQSSKLLFSQRPRHWTLLYIASIHWVGCHLSLIHYSTPDKQWVYDFELCFLVLSFPSVTEGRFSSYLLLSLLPRHWTSQYCIDPLSGLSCIIYSLLYFKQTSARPKTVWFRTMNRTPAL